MRQRIPVLLGLLFATAVAAPVFGARVKKQNGEFVEGEIRGYVVLQRIQAASSAFSDRLMGYVVIQGKYISMPDENGVQAEEGKSLVIVESAKALRLSEPEFVLSETRDWFDLKKFKDNINRVLTLPSGIRVVGGVSKFDATLFKVVGEFRVDSWGGELIPALEIKSKKGGVSVPVTEIRAPGQSSIAPAEIAPLETEQDPMGVILTAKSVALVAVGPAPGFARGFAKRFMTRRQNPDAERAKKHLRSELEEMKRFTFIEDPLQADLVLAIEEGEQEIEESFHLSTIYLYDRLSIFKGGVVPDEKAQPLWKRFYRVLNRPPSELPLQPSRRVAFQFRKDIENAEKWRKKLRVDSQSWDEGENENTFSSSSVLAVCGASFCAATR